MAEKMWISSWQFGPGAGTIRVSKEERRQRMKPEMFTPAKLVIYEYRCTSAWMRLTEQEKLDGLTWYQRYHSLMNYLSKTFDKNLMNVCESAAWLSLGCDWDIALKQLIQMMRNGTNGMDTVCSTYNPNKIKAFKCLEEKESFIHRGSPKADRFARLLHNPQESMAVACDRHHCFAITGKKPNGGKGPDSDSGITSNQYELLELCTQNAALRLGIKPHQLQAGIWVRQKKEAFVWE